MKKNLFLNASFILFSLPIQAQTHGSDVTTPLNIWPRTRYFEAIQAGASNKLFIGGRDAAGFISWGAYPDNNTATGTYRFSYNTAPASRQGYENWSNLMVWQFSQGTGAVGSVVSWNTKLSLNGDGIMRLCGEFTSRRVVVDLLNGWCDDVFERDYPLMSLHELEQFIQTNKHLPEIPAEKEIREKGIDIGEMQKLHMKKIEELTLYIIQQQKEIDGFRKELAAIRSAVRSK